MKKYNIILMFFLFGLFLESPLLGNIKEGELKSYGRSFLQKVLSDNPGRGASIRQAMGGMIRRGNGGISLLDKFALFMYDSSKNGLVIDRVKYFTAGRSVSMLIVLRDLSDKRLYNLFVEYKYRASGNSYHLGDIYFSSVFMKRLRAVKRFFGGD